MRSSRGRRIDRALSSVLETIERQHDEALDRFINPSWRVLDELSIEFDRRRIGAYVRADNLCAKWHARVSGDA